VARRCDDTIDKNRVNSCVLRHLFLEGVEQPKKNTQNPRKCFLRHATNVTFSKFRWWRRKKKTPRGFLKTALRAVLCNDLINSGPMVLKSCFLHCTPSVCWCKAACVCKSPSLYFFSVPPLILLCEPIFLSISVPTPSTLSHSFI